MYAIRSYYDCCMHGFLMSANCHCRKIVAGIVITSYSIHYTKLYERKMASQVKVKM